MLPWDRTRAVRHRRDRRVARLAAGVQRRAGAQFHLRRRPSTTGCSRCCRSCTSACRSACSALLWVHTQRVPRRARRSRRGRSAIGVTLALLALSLVKPALCRAAGRPRRRADRRSRFDWFYLPVYPLLYRWSPARCGCSSAALTLLLRAAAVAAAEAHVEGGRAPAGAPRQPHRPGARPARRCSRRRCAKASRCPTSAATAAAASASARVLYGAVDYGAYQESALSRRGARGGQGARLQRDAARRHRDRIRAAGAAGRHPAARSTRRRWSRCTKASARRDASCSSRSRRRADPLLRRPVHQHPARRRRSKRSFSFATAPHVNARDRAADPADPRRQVHDPRVHRDEGRRHACASRGRWARSSCARTPTSRSSSSPARPASRR